MNDVFGFEQLVRERTQYQGLELLGYSFGVASYLMIYALAIALIMIIFSLIRRRFVQKKEEKDNE